ncbi:CFEM domain-containing [Fusarium albosuccineum]|uniref:CFEM domain-containing n=1 Tax=Fusarium albosuccineum TaxID=1237068 RepID=A0A8H4L5X4_9HYPO|nr:CFEM domain-containing [Fusarium albosuccineum]
MMGRFLQTLTITIAFFSVSSFTDEATAEGTGTGGCKPHAWENTRHNRAAFSSHPPRPKPTYSVPIRKKFEAGDLNCRWWADTYQEVDSSTCQKLADDYHIDISTLFELNPILEPDCERIRPYTKYCVQGWPMMDIVALCITTPLVAGRKIPVATLKLGHVATEGRDCTPSLCYKGAGDCELRVIVSTDGICGLVEGRHTLRVCGEWGDCCNLQGKCGSGPDFCGDGICQAGECYNNDYPMNKRPARLSWEYGDGLP